MNRLFFGLLTALVFLVPSWAADQPSSGTAPRTTPVSAPQWDGFYVGAQGGWQEIRNSFSDIGINGSIGDNNFADINHNSFVGGAKAGYDISINNFVFGIVSDIDAGRSRMTYRNPNNWGFNQQLRILGSFRTRAGISFGQLLFYGTAGITRARVSTVYNDGGDTLSFSDRRIGWTVGTGLEYMLDQKWSALVEYRYSDFGHILYPAPTPWQSYNDTHRVTANTIQVGVNYRFGQ